MKSIYIVLLFLLFVSQNAQSQDVVLASTQYPELRYAPLRGEVFYSAYRQIKGNAYLTNDWSIGSIYLKNGDVIRQVQYKFDLHAHRILIYQDNLKRIVIPDKNDIKSFTLTENGKIRTFVSANSELTSDKSLSQYFLEVLAEGNVAFYKLYYNNILPLKQPEMPYIDEFIERQDYYIMFRNKYEEAKLKKSYLFNTFPQYKQEIRKYIKENKLKLKRENDFASVIAMLGKITDQSSK